MRLSLLLSSVILLTSRNGRVAFATEEHEERDRVYTRGQVVPQRGDDKANPQVEVSPLQQDDEDFPSKELDDFLCENQRRSPWCPDNPITPQQLSKNELSFSGTINMIVVLIRFKDHIDRPQRSRSDYIRFFNSYIRDSAINPTGSVREYFESQGPLRISAHVQEWITIDKTEEEASLYKNGLYPEFGLNAIPSLERMDQQGNIDWRTFDRNGDGVLDAVYIMHSGRAAETGGIDCENGRKSGKHRIWSHQAIPNPNHPGQWSSQDGKVKLGSYATSAALVGSCGQNLARLGVVVHEIGHMLGLPDMIGSRGGWGTGVFDVMGAYYGLKRNQLNPGSFSAWSKQYVGWVTPTILTESDVYYIQAVQTSGQVYRIDVGFPPGEYILIENRQLFGYDVDLPGHGLLVWHIDEKEVSTKWNSNPGWPDQSGWPGNGKHYEVALLSPDGNYDLERGANDGDAGDYWIEGMTLGVGPATNIAAYFGSQFTYPNTDTYSSGKIKMSHVTISEISPSGPTMSFNFTYDAPNAVTTPSPTPSPTESPTPDPTNAPTPKPTSRPTAAPKNTPKPTSRPTAAPKNARYQQFANSQKTQSRPTPKYRFDYTNLIRQWMASHNFKDYFKNLNLGSYSFGGTRRRRTLRGDEEEIPKGSKQ